MISGHGQCPLHQPDPEPKIQGHAPSEILLAENDAANVDSALWIPRITRIAADQFGQWDSPL